MLMLLYLFSPRLLFLFHPHFFLIYGRFGVEVLGLDTCIGFLRLGFVVDGFGACGVGPTGFLGDWALYINTEE